MAYRDDPYAPGDDGGDGVEMPQSYRGDPGDCDDGDAGEYGVVAPERPTSGGRCRSFGKALLAAYVLATLAVGGHEYDGYVRGGGSGDDDAASGGLEGGPPRSKRLIPKKIGVRGKRSIGSSNDEEGEISNSGRSSGDTISSDEEIGRETLEGNENESTASSPGDHEAGSKDEGGVKNEAAVSSPNDRGAGTPATSKVPEDPDDVVPLKAPEEPAEAPPPAPESTKRNAPCEDDDDFVLPNLKTCQTFIANVGRPLLHEARCAQKVGLTIDGGFQLELKHICRKSCGNCGDDDAAKNEYAEELEELEEKEKEGEEVGFANDEEGPGYDEEEGEEEDAELWEDLKEEENDFQEEVLGEESVIPNDPNEEGNESEDELTIGEGADSVSEGKFHEPPPAAEEIPRPLDEDEEGEPLKDYFVPLTELERDAMKERLRGTLKQTKDALAMTNALKAVAEETRYMMRVDWQRTLVLSGELPKEFMYLQHNQTGSDEVGALLQCALDRQQDVQKTLRGDPISIGAISEGDNMEMCLNELASMLGATLINDEFYMNGKDGKPTDKTFELTDNDLGIPDEARNACGTSDANVMSYCTSLNAVNTFGWLGVDSISMFANPVQQLHLTYQRTAQRCYGCRELTDVLREIKGGTFGREEGARPSTAYDPRDSCAVQMIGHQGTNLLHSSMLHDVANDVSFPREKMIVEEAVRNLREGITWIGLLDQIDDSVAGFREVFPWLAENLNEVVKPLEEELRKGGNQIGNDVDFALPINWIDRNGCPFETKYMDYHTCGSREVDDEALRLIKELNMRDLAVYKAARERFALQKEVIREYREALRLDV